jgi:CubicO group peptidase (beta-lactamase class C family)
VIGELGEVFYYNNQMYATAGYLAPLVTGVPYGQLPEAYAALMQERIYGPIGMKAAITEDPSVVSDNYALGHETTVLGGPSPSPQCRISGLLRLHPQGEPPQTWSAWRAISLPQLNEGAAPDGTRVVSAENLARTWVPQTPLPTPASADVDSRVTRWDG